MRFSSSSAMPSRVVARLSGVPFTRISLFCKEITTERRLGSFACGFSGISGIPPVVSTSEVHPAVRQDSITHEEYRKNLANVFMLITFMQLLFIFISHSLSSSGSSSPFPVLCPVPCGTILPLSPGHLPDRPAHRNRSMHAGHRPLCSDIAGQLPGLPP